MKKTISALLLFLAFIVVNAQNRQTSDCQEKIVENKEDNESVLVRKTCPESGADTLFVYNKRSKLKAYYDYGTYSKSNGNVFYCYYRHKPFESCRKITGFFTSDGKKTGEWKYYKKNDVLWDYVIYENNKQAKWIRYNKEGKIVFEKQY